MTHVDWWKVTKTRDRQTAQTIWDPRCRTALGLRGGILCTRCSWSQPKWHPTENHLVSFIWTSRSQFWPLVTCFSTVRNETTLGSWLPGRHTAIVPPRKMLWEGCVIEDISIMSTWVSYEDDFKMVKLWSVLLWHRLEFKRTLSGQGGKTPPCDTNSGDGAKGCHPRAHKSI